VLNVAHEAVLQDLGRLILKGEQLNRQTIDVYFFQEDRQS